MAVVKFRIDDTKIPSIDAAAKREGMTRSAWLKFLIEGVVRVDKSDRPATTNVDDQHRKIVRMRMNRRQFSALETMAHDNGIYVSDAAKKIIFSRLYEGDHIMVQSKKALEALNELTNELNRIGVNINQSTRALKGAMETDSGINVKTIISAFMAKLDALIEPLSEVKEAVLKVADEDQLYWRGVGDDIY